MNERRKERKKEILPGLEPGPSDCQSDAFTTELLELWHWSGGWISLLTLSLYGKYRGTVCTEVVYADTS